MKKIKRSLMGAMAGFLALPAWVSAQAPDDTSWAEKYLPTRTKQSVVKPISPYNPNAGQRQETPVILQTGFFRGDTGFKPTPLPGLWMAGQNADIKPGANGYVANQELLPKPMIVPPPQPMVVPQPNPVPMPLPPATKTTSDGTPVPMAVQGAPVPVPQAGTAPVPQGQGLVQYGTVRSGPQVGTIVNGQKGAFVQQVLGSNDPCAIPCDPCGPCGPCGPAGRFWASAEYVWAWQKGMNLPPLVTGAPFGQPVQTAGTLGQPTTSVLYGGDSVLGNGNSGLRLRAGLWLDECRRWGIDAGYLYLPSRSANFSASSPGNPGLFRPFFNPVTGTQFTELVAFNDPNTGPVLAGTVGVRSSSDLNTGDVNLRRALSCDPCGRLDFLFGYRYFQLSDSVNIQENLRATDPAGVRAPLGTTFLVNDNFKTTNTFNGGQIGLAGERRVNNWIYGGSVKVALGNMNSVTEINGFTISQIPGQAPVRGTGGLLALPTNIGRYESNRFTVIPEVGLNLGYAFTQNIRGFVGYNFLYANNVMRAGDQIDLVVNPTQIPPGTLAGPARPAFPNKTTDYWLQTVSVGLELRF